MTALLPEGIRHTLVVTHVIDERGVVVHLGDGAATTEAIRIRIDRGLGEESALAHQAKLLTLAVAFVAAQATLAPVVSVDFRLAPESESLATRLLTLLYDSHGYAQRLLQWPTPELRFTGTAIGAPSRRRGGAPDPSVVLLWSGGKDSLAALDVLRLNGYNPVGLHAEINLGVESVERTAADRLAGDNDVPLTRIDVHWPAIATMLEKWSDSSSRFPLANSIPHGRDVVLAIAGGLLAGDIGASHVAAGYEYELWSKQITYRGREIARHDVQSRSGALLVDRLLDLELGVRFFSPLAGLREMAILEHLVTVRRDAWSVLASCFWDRWCGRCSKCLRYALAQAVLGDECIDFASDPLDESSPALVQLCASVTDPDTPFWEQQVRNLYALHRGGRFASSGTVRTTLDANLSWYQERHDMFQQRLSETYPDALAPAGFQWRFPNSALKSSPTLKSEHERNSL